MEQEETTTKRFFRSSILPHSVIISSGITMCTMPSWTTMIITLRGRDGCALSSEIRLKVNTRREQIDKNLSQGNEPVCTVNVSLSEQRITMDNCSSPITFEWLDTISHCHIWWSNADYLYRSIRKSSNHWLINTLVIVVTSLQHRRFPIFRERSIFSSWASIFLKYIINHQFRRKLWTWIWIRSRCATEISVHFAF